jgi:riboflavin transporter FmnP
MNGWLMNSRTIGVIIAFTALTTVLDFIRIPVPYLPMFNYQMGDIALVVVFLIFGVTAGVAVAFFNMIISMIIFTGPAGLVGAPYYFIAVTSMFLGILIASKIVKKPAINRIPLNLKPIILFTTLTILTRTIIMLPLDYTVFGWLVSIVSGLSISAAYAIVLAAMPGIILYNITVPLYVVPISCFIAKKVSKSLKIQNTNTLIPKDKPQLQLAFS